MYYVTCRQFNESFVSKSTPSTYKKGDVQPSSTYTIMRQDTTTKEHFGVGSVTFSDEMKKHSNKHIIFYAHGFNVTPNSALEGGGRLQAGLDPTKYLVIPVLWQCEDSLVNLAERYYTDRLKAENSGVAIAKFFNYFKIAIANPNVSIICHSMGNRMFCHSLRHYQNLGFGSVAGLFKNVFMVAADTVNECLQGNSYGNLIPPASKNVIVASASDDTALNVSAIVNYIDLEPPGQRLGRTGMQNWTQTPVNCVDVDCSNGNNAADPATGHGYFYPMDGLGGNLFRVIKKVIDTDSIFWDISTTRSAFKVENLAAGL